MGFLHNDLFLKIAGAVVGICAIGAHYLPSNTIAQHVCVVAVGIGAALGIYSTTGREPAPAPDDKLPPGPVFK